ncbi:MAG: sulfatase-like hydrolase/transferase [Candidatus Poribacteria bacterium]|nr:sulfatase-like hydrolase/transferase [Candidatus Poribacteria bacterium]
MYEWKFTETRPFSRRDFLSTSMKAGAAAFTTALLPKLQTEAQEQYNVLFIMVDDLRPMLGCYGYSEMQTPNIDRIAQQGTVFNRAYCQFPLCNPSRGSLLTGLRPNTTEIKDNTSTNKDTLPGTTIPQQFKDNGYYTCSVGKIAHGWYAWTDKVSWSKRIWKIPFEEEYYNAKPTEWKILDVADEELRDGMAARKAIEEMSTIKDIPFFLAVGFDRPHVPFHAPRKYYDLYSTKDFSLPPNHRSLPKNAPGYSLSADLQKFSEELILQLTHAYAACISYVDAQVGLLLDHLEKLELTEKTILVFMSDHGFHLGEHAKWEKGTLFEVGLRTPLIVSVPGQTQVGVRTNALVELVDVFPTLCDACNISIPFELEGHSMLPVIKQPDLQWKSAAFSQLRRRLGQVYYRKESLKKMTGIELTEKDTVDGYSMRTNRYRYTEWGAYTEHGEKFADLSVELYDYLTDPDETVNIANLPENAELVSQLSKKLQLGWQEVLSEIDGSISVSHKKLPWDINEDGIVDTEDLLLVSKSFGLEKLENPKVDVNRDGSVNIIDLLIVAAHFGETSNSSAPQIRANIPQHQLDILAKRLSEAYLADDGSSIFREGISVLESILDSSLPGKTTLLRNYPNPFNPETWIPYQLAKPANVSISIYSMNGTLVRTLKLGNLSAGVYRSKSRAAYWDGKNKLGESVASGIYFYTLTAGEFKSTRKMLIRK